MHLLDSKRGGLVDIDEVGLLEITLASWGATTLWSTGAVAHI